MNGRLDISKSIMGILVSETVKRSELVKLEASVSAGRHWIRERTFKQARSCLHDREDIHARIAPGDRQIGRVQGLPERALQERLIKPEGIVAEKDRGPPSFKASSDLCHHLIETRQCRITQQGRPYPGYHKGHRRWYDPGQTPAPDIEPVQFFEAIVGQDRCKLKDLVEIRVRAGRFSVVEDEQTITPDASRREPILSPIRFGATTNVSRYRVWILECGKVFWETVGLAGLIEQRSLASNLIVPDGDFI